MAKRKNFDTFSEAYFRDCAKSVSRRKVFFINFLSMKVYTSSFSKIKIILNFYVINLRI